MVNKLAIVVSAALLAVAGGSAYAATVTLGEQDFEDGATFGAGLNINTYQAAQVGEPAPFDAFRGSDPGGIDFSESWTFNFTPESPGSAHVMLGIYDHDCFNPSCSVVQSFTVDGSDFTGAFSSALQTTGTFGQATYDVVTIDLSSISRDFADGVLMMALTMQPPASNFTGNGIGLDFAQLTTLRSVPLPAAAWLFLGALGSFGLLRWRRDKAV